MSDANLHALQNVIDGAENVPETIEQAILRLSILSPIDYDRVREKEAKALGIRLSTLDAEIQTIRNPDKVSLDAVKMFPTVESWPHPVKGAALLDEIAGTIRQFIVCDADTVTATTLWIAFTWIIDRVNVAPLAVITAPEKRCGKSQLLDLIGRLSRRPLVASNISPAAIFRVIEAHGPTLLIDEADTFLKENEEARGILNSGHTRRSAYVIRVVGEDHTPQQFSTWGAKAISGIGYLPDTLMDRAIILELRRKLPHEAVERIRHADVTLFERLASKLSRWAEDNGFEIASTRPLLPEALNDRAQDNWEPLLMIADCAGGRWPELARMAALNISGDKDESLSLSSELLADIKEVFGGRDRIGTKDLLDALNADDEKPWSTYYRGKPMIPRQLSKLLKGYGIKPDTLSFSGIKAKGYKREWFNDAFTRYLSGPSSDSPKISVAALPFSAKSPSEPERAVTDNNAVTVTHTPSVTAKSLQTAASNGTPNKTGNAGGDMVEERAAIMEYDAPDCHATRDSATLAAYADVLKNNQNLSNADEAL